MTKKLLVALCVSACCNIPQCPRASIVGVPAADERWELPLPLSSEDRAKLSARITGCDSGGASLCTTSLTKAQRCLLDRLTSPLPTTDPKHAADELAHCGGPDAITL